MSFQLEFQDMRKGAALLKACECILPFSDTALLKTNEKGLFVSVTDPDSLACAELRFVPKELKTKDEFTAKILLSSLITLIKAARKNKWSLHGRDQIVHVRQHPQQQQHDQAVESTSHRARIYHVMSARTFMGKNSDDYLCLHIKSQELQRIITRQVLTAGRNGGISEIHAWPPNEGPEPLGQTHVQFTTFSNLGFHGGYCKMDLYANNESTSIARVHHAPTTAVQFRYFISYLRKPCKLFDSAGGDNIWYISNKGMLLESKQRDDVSVHIFCVNVDLKHAAMLL